MLHAKVYTVEIAECMSLLKSSDIAVTKIHY